MKKQLKIYFKNIKKNLPCLNSTMRKMLNDLKMSVNTFIEENNVADFTQIEQHFGSAEDIAKEFAAGIDSAFVKSYKFKKRITTIVISILTAILVIIASLSVYIYIENEMNNYRAQLKNQNVVDVNNKEYDYQMGVHYMDLIGECEKLGDYVVNVVEARTNVKEKKTNDNR